MNKKVEFKLRCQHNTKPRTSKKGDRPLKKNTNCPATLQIVILKQREPTSGNKRCRSILDPHLPEMQMVVVLNHDHNHPIIAADALQHRDVSQEVKEKLLGLFKLGHTPSKALELHKYDLQIEYPDDYVQKSADRAICPDLGFCYRLYYKTFTQEYGKATGEEVLKRLENKIEEYNSVIEGHKSVDFCVVGDKKQDVVVAIVTPLMRCVHRNIKHSGEMAFIDATGNMDRQGCRVFLILTHSCAGGLPLGVLITTSESAEVITQGLGAFQGLLDESSFYGRGSKGPAIFMTDDSAAERQALQHVYPDATLLLCVFHLLQAFWRFLWDSKNGVKKEDRPPLLSLLKALVYSETAEILNMKYSEATASTMVKRYQNVAKHFDSIYERRNSWALCLRTDMNTRNNNTNNFEEAGMRILKDQIVERTKVYNVIQLVDFMINRLEAYYERRLLDICHNRLDRALTSRYLPNDKAGSSIPIDSIVKTGDNTYSVPSEKNDSTDYTVDASVGICTCWIGKTGGPCKHQYLVVKKFNITSWNFFPVNDPSMRQVLFKVATGNSTPPREGWFQSLHSYKNDAVDDISADVELVLRALNPPPLVKPLDVSDGDDVSMEPVLEAQNPTPLDSLLLQRDLQNKFDERNAKSAPENSHSPGASGVSNTLLSELQSVFDTIAESYNENHQYFEKPLRAFVKQANALNTNSALSSALQRFGKYSGAALALKKRKSRGLVSCKSIGVQPTAPARRKVLGGGRNRVGSGRPCKVLKGENKENECKGQKVPFSSQVMPRRKAPHNLSSCVQRNVALGKTHSAQ